ncbi:MAG TPA: NADH-quinone oxidoreductase subunit C, partial [Thermoanaerobaculia bacterium]|nr:NADH-quinone oxidoreductase subunit C [Thermoanaerobaculia bacterium]
SGKGMAGEEIHPKGGEALRPAWERDPVAPRWEDAGDEPLVQALREAHGDAVEAARRYAGDLTLRIRRENLLDVARSLKDEHGFTLLLDLRGTADPDGSSPFQTVYSLQSPETSQRVRLKVAAPVEAGEVEAEKVAGEEIEAEPGTEEENADHPPAPPAGFPSVSGLWRGAAWLEREVHDRFGARFEGHSDLEEDDRPSAVEEEMEVRFASRPPAPPGLLRLRLRIDGERLAHLTAGSPRREAEEHLALRPFPQSLDLARHPDSPAAVAAGLAACGTVERLAGLAVPPRARSLRTVFAELERLASHLLWLAVHAAEVGDPGPAPACLRERERVLELLAEEGGPRLIPGGLLRDLPDGWGERCRAFLDGFGARLDEVETRLTENRVWKKRTVGVGILPPEVALEHGVTGPLLRASGVARDLRKDRPYEAYGEVDFEVAVGKSGDTYDRYCVRVAEMRQSARIVALCLDRLPGGAVRAYCPAALRAAGDAEIYHGVEAPRGEVGCHVSGLRAPDGEDRGLYRCQLRTPSAFHLQVLPELARGQRLASLVALVGTCDLAFGIDV